MEKCMNNDRFNQMLDEILRSLEQGMYRQAYALIDTASEYFYPHSIINVYGNE